MVNLVSSLPNLQNIPSESMDEIIETDAEQGRDC